MLSLVYLLCFLNASETSPVLAFAGDATDLYYSALLLLVIFELECYSSGLKYS